MAKTLKKYIFLVLIPNFLIISPAIAKNYSNKKKSVIEINKVDENKQESFDFRKTKWGMTHQQVQQSEGREPVSQDTDRLVFSDSLFGIPAGVNYFFENARLLRAGYLFEGPIVDPAQYIINFKKIKEALLEKYGNPAFDNSKELDLIEKDSYKQVGDLISRGAQEYETRWETTGTEIKLSLKGKNVFSKIRLELVYTSKNLKQLDESKAEEKDKF